MRLVVAVITITLLVFYAAFLRNLIEDGYWFLIPILIAITFVWGWYAQTPAELAEMQKRRSTWAAKWRRRLRLERSTTSETQQPVTPARLVQQKRPVSLDDAQDL